MNEFTILGANARAPYFDEFGERLWLCDSCGKQSRWGPGWSWWGNYVRRGSQVWYDNGTMEWVACSPGCAEKLKGEVSATALDGKAPIGDVP